MNFWILPHAMCMYDDSSTLAMMQNTYDDVIQVLYYSCIQVIFSVATHKHLYIYKYIHIQHPYNVLSLLVK